MNSFKTLLSLISIIIMIVFGFLLNDNYKTKIKIKEQDLTIVKLENAVITKENEIKILDQDIKQKQTVILALEEKARANTVATQEAIDRLIELANIERGVVPSEGPIDIHEQITAPSQPEEVTPPPKPESSNSAAEKKENKVEIIDDSSSKKFIDLRNNIYSRYK